jgi:ribose transport system permease protein
MNNGKVIEKTVKGRAGGADFKEGFKNAVKVNSSVLIPMIVLFVVAGIFVPKFASFTNAMSLLRSMSTTALIAFPMTMVLITGGIDLTVGSMQALSGCIVTLMLANTGVPSVVTLLLTMGLAIVIGLLNGSLITRLNMPPFIVTIAMMYVIRGIAYTLTDGKPIPVPNDALFGFIGQGYIGGAVPVTVIYVIIAFILLWFVLNRTRFGRHVYAVGGNAVAAQYSGINVKKTITITYIFTSAFAAFAGIVLTSRMNSGQPTIGEGSELDIIAACIVGGVSMNGGTGTIAGTLMGALIVTGMANMMNLLGLGSFAQMIAKGLIMIAFVYITTLRKQAQLKAKKKEIRKNADTAV